MFAINSHYGEIHIRNKFSEYIRRFVECASAYEFDLINSANNLSSRRSSVSSSSNLSVMTGSNGTLEGHHHQQQHYHHSSSRIQSQEEKESPRRSQHQEADQQPQLPAQTTTKADQQLQRFTTKDREPTMNTDNLANALQSSSSGQNQSTPTGSTSGGFSSEKQYISQLLSQCPRAIFADENTKKKELSAIRPRVELWKTTQSCRLYIQDHNTYIATRSISNLNTYGSIEKLRQLNGLNEAEVTEIYQELVDNIENEAQILEVSQSLFVECR